MNMHRTVAWLALFVVITPFLAIPDWLAKAALTVLGIAIIGTAWLTRPDMDQPSSQDSSDTDGLENQPGPGDQNRDPEPSSTSTSEDPQQQLDIEDPEADTMMAADRWRRRASRDIT